MVDHSQDGPSLQTYVETRFNLLTEAILAASNSQASSLSAAIEGMKAALAAAKVANETLSAAADMRYQQRFEAQSDALAAAFQSQQQAMQTAFTVAEKAVQAALAAADRAVSKAELASDKRFEALNELRQMLNDMVGNLIPRPEATQRFDSLAEKINITNNRIDALDVRMSSATALDLGGKATSDNTRANISIAISTILFIMAIATFIFARMNP